MVEFKRTRAGNFVLMEINPRLWGSVALAIDAGVDFPPGLLALARRENLSSQPQYRIGHYCRLMPEDIEWCFVNFFADHKNPLLLTRNRIITILEFNRPLMFKETWDHFGFDDLRVGSAIFRRAFGMFAEQFRKLWRRATLNWKLERQHRNVVREWRPRNSPPKILFVCFGNICRSPVAEYLARRALPDWSIASAGFYPKEDRRSPEHIRTAAAELGLEMSAHASRLITASEVEGADLILVMDSHNLSQLRSQFPSAMDRTTLLGFFGQQAKPEISDPLVLSASETMIILRQIEAAVNGLHTWITSKRAAGVIK